MRFRACLVLLGLLVAVLPITTSAYELDTHEQLSRAAFQVSGIASTLQSAYGIYPQDTFRGRISLRNFQRHTPADWIAKGGRDEDSPWSRELNHFYDPYHDEPLGFSGATRAPDWALEDRGDFTQPPQNYSYKDAREALYQALTARDSTTHEREFGHVFYALGHVIHLIQDMAQPQHTRNDSHFFIGPTASLMEQYVNVNIRRFTLSGATLPTVARARDLWVTGTGGNGSGLSEFSNANFVSAGTNFTELRTGATAARFPKPILNIGDFSLSSSADACKDGAPAPEHLIFFANAFTDPVTGDGLRNEKMTTYSIFDQYLIPRGRPPMFALNCFNLDTAASILLPRAVSYSAALLKYFFRGQIDVAPPSRFVYGLAAYAPGNSGAFTKLRFKVRNATPNEDAGPGQLTAVVRYRTSTLGQDLIVNPFAPISTPRFAVSRPIDLDSLSRDFQEFPFDFTESPIPTNSADLFLTVVYKARLGQEDGAVMVGGRDLFEPDPLDRGNITDYDCFADQLRYVVNLPPYHYPDHTERDVDQDGTQDLFGPGLETGLYVKTFDLSEPFPSPSDGNFDFENTGMAAAQYTRFMLLQDKPTYGAVMLDRQIQDFSTGSIFENSWAAFAINGVVNDVIRGSQGQVVRRVTQTFPYRDVPTFHLMFRYNANTAPCLAQTQFLTPPLTRIDGVLPAE